MQHHSPETDGVAIQRITFIDETRPIKPSFGFDGAPVRRLDCIIWQPADPENSAAADTGPWPLIIYSHGTFGQADNITYLAHELVRRGYMVAAPDYPLTSRVAFTNVKAPDISDVSEQTRDLHFLIDSLLADRFTGPNIDAGRIGVMGHSLGAVTSYFTVFGKELLDPRIGAAALLGAGDPVQAALSADMGLWGTWGTPVHLPVLFVSAERDLFARMTGRAHAAYYRLETPKYEVMIKRGVHVWFHEGAEQPADNKNPDCVFFEQMPSAASIPGFTDRSPLIAWQKQQEITCAAVGAFFDAYLKNDAGAAQSLATIDTNFPDAELIFEL